MTGGERLTEGELARGNFVAPTVVRVPADSSLWTDELFAPIIAVATVGSLDEGIERANDTPYGLTAGLFAGVRQEIDRFLERIEAGVVYVNRAAGATTGAWPGVQPFGGWKRSGTAGKAGGGPYYLQQYLREQSRTDRQLTAAAAKRGHRRERPVGVTARRAGVAPEPARSCRRSIHTVGSPSCLAPARGRGTGDWATCSSRSRCRPGSRRASKLAPLGLYEPTSSAVTTRSNSTPRRRALAANEVAVDVGQDDEAVPLVQRGERRRRVGERRPVGHGRPEARPAPRRSHRRRTGRRPAAASPRARPGSASSGARTRHRFVGGVRLEQRLVVDAVRSRVHGRRASAIPVSQSMSVP